MNGRKSLRLIIFVKAEKIDCSHNGVFLTRWWWTSADEMKDWNWSHQRLVLLSKIPIHNAYSMSRSWIACDAMKGVSRLWVLRVCPREIHQLKNRSNKMSKTTGGDGFLRERCFWCCKRHNRASKIMPSSLSLENHMVRNNLVDVTMRNQYSIEFFFQEDKVQIVDWSRRSCFFHFWRIDSFPGNTIRYVEDDL